MGGGHPRVMIANYKPSERKRRRSCLAPARLGTVDESRFEIMLNYPLTDGIVVVLRLPPIEELGRATCRALS